MYEGLDFRIEKVPSIPLLGYDKDANKQKSPSPKYITLLLKP